MIKIIKPGTKKKVTCKECGCLFSYESEDIKSNLSRSANYVICPQCEEKVYIKCIRTPFAE